MLLSLKELIDARKNRRSAIIFGVFKWIFISGVLIINSYYAIFFVFAYKTDMIYIVSSYLDSVFSHSCALFASVFQLAEPND